MSVKNCDIIALSKQDFDDLRDWAIKNNDVLANFHQIMNEGLVNCFDKAFLYFNVIDEDRTDFWICVETDMDIGFSGWFYTSNSEERLYLAGGDSIPAEDRPKILNVCGLLYTCYKAALSYMFHYKKDVAMSTQVETKSKPSGYKKKTKHKKSKPVKITRKVYKLSTPVNKRKVPKKAQWSGIQWSVRGHIRHYKSGKVTYVHPYIKGDKSGEFRGKLYQM